MNVTYCRIFSFLTVFFYVHNMCLVCEINDIIIITIREKGVIV